MERSKRRKQIFEWHLESVAMESFESYSGGLGSTTLFNDSGNAFKLQFSIVKTCNFGKSPTSSGTSTRPVHPSSCRHRSRLRLPISSGSATRPLQALRSKKDKLSQHPMLRGISFSSLHFMQISSSSKVSCPISGGKCFRLWHFNSESSTRLLQWTMEGGKITSDLHSRKYSLVSLVSFPIEEGSVFSALHLSRESSSRDDRPPRDSGRRVKALLATPDDPPSRNRFKLLRPEISSGSSEIW